MLELLKRIKRISEENDYQGVIQEIERYNANLRTRGYKICTEETTQNKLVINDLIDEVVTSSNNLSASDGSEESLLLQGVILGNPVLSNFFKEVNTNVIDKMKAAGNIQATCSLLESSINAYMLEAKAIKVENEKLLKALNEGKMHTDELLLEKSKLVDKLKAFEVKYEEAYANSVEATALKEEVTELHSQLNRRLTQIIRESQKEKTKLQAQALFAAVGGISLGVAALKIYQTWRLVSSSNVTNNNTVIKEKEIITEVEVVKEIKTHSCALDGNFIHDLLLK